MKLPPYLFWWAWVKKIVWDPFWWVILFVIILWVPFLRVWWWVFLPWMLMVQLKELYIWWLDWDFEYAKQKWIILEIVPPKEVLIPLKAMEDVLGLVWPIWDHPTFREKWCDGILDDAPGWCSFEIASIEGKIHFYLRCLQQHKLMIESALFAHYPDLELHEVNDYTKLVPPTVPNEEWDMYGENFILKTDPAYPIKTYEKFFEPQGERIAAEEKRIDPIISLLESMSKLGPGEHYWVQFILMPIESTTDVDCVEYRAKGTKIINKITKRPEKKEPTLFEDLSFVAKEIFIGPAKEGEGESASYSWLPQNKEEEGEREMVLTPGEREIITEIEKKLQKPVFRTNIKGIYVAKRENWKSAHGKIARGYLAHFTTQHMNFIRFDPDTRTKVHYFLRNRRVFLRARKLMRTAVMRLPPLFPDRQSNTAIFSTEEVATLFHFPLRVSGMVAPTMENVESKKAGPPPNLPTE